VIVPSSRIGPGSNVHVAIKARHRRASLTERC
jgi:hypothetical protein